jgi:hypothetical protein
LRRSKDNPEGYTVLAVAENRQSVDLMQERMAHTAPVPRQAFFYDSFQGVERFRKALVNMLTNTFMKVGRIDGDARPADCNSAVAASHTTRMLSLLWVFQSSVELLNDASQGFAAKCAYLSACNRNACRRAAPS